MFQGAPIAIAEVSAQRDLKPGAWLHQAETVTVCFDLPKGPTTLSV